MSRSNAGDVPPGRSAAASRFMASWFARFLKRHLNALRIARWGRPETAGHAGPLVVYCNHPSWWDAAVIAILADKLFPTRASFAPFDAEALARYGIFRRIGAFPVEPDTARGAARFLKAARGILANRDAVLWITAQGRFADARARPLGLKAGVARLPEFAPGALVLPLAIEFAFWDERGAEAFCAFGESMKAADLAALPRSVRLDRIEKQLTATLDRLSVDVIAREPSRFEALVSGEKGIGGLYDGWRRLRAVLSGRRFDPAHRPDEMAGRRGS